ncbi:MAG: diguanylate cyclase [Desulfovibrionaceae bacterium]
MPQIQVKSKLVFALSVILVVSFVATSLINYQVSTESIRQELLNSSLPLTSENIYSEIHTDLLKPINVSSLMANDTFVINWIESGERETNRITSYLGQIRLKYGFFASFLVSSRTGNYYHPGGILKQVGPDDDHDTWYYEFLGTGLEYDLDVDTNQAADNKLTIFINFRVLNKNGETIGVTGVGLEMARIAKLLKYYQRKYDRNIYLVSPDGIIQTHMDKRLIMTDSAPLWGRLAPQLKDILTPRAEPRQYEVDRGGHHMLLSVRYIPEFDWFLVVEQDERGALTSARSNLVRTLVVGLLASAVILLLSTITVNHFQRKLERMASTDELTGVANRREFEAQFDRARHRRERYDMDFSFILLDIDGLKQINDTHGHLMGDEAIVGVANIVLETLRSNDVVARWGGDEFIVLVEGDAEQARAAAERIRSAVFDARLPKLKNGGAPASPISVSCGVAQYRPEDTLEHLTGRADTALYRAKRDGKNAVKLG